MIQTKVSYVNHATDIKSSAAYRGESTMVNFTFTQNSSSFASCLICAPPPSILQLQTLLLFIQCDTASLLWHLHLKMHGMSYADSRKDSSQGI